MTRLIIHLGYPKTATTTLQKHFFNKCQDINYLGRPFKDKNFKKAMFIISDYDDIAFEENIDFLVNVFKSNLDKNKINILSSEHHTHKFTLVLGGAAERNLGMIAKRLKLVLSFIEDLKVEFLFTLRNQSSMIESYFIQKYLDFSRTDLDTFEKFYQYSINNLEHGLMFSLNYYKVISYYEKLFSKDVINVLLFEELVSDKQYYYNKLANILDIETSEVLKFLYTKKDNLSHTDKKGKKYKNIINQRSKLYCFLKNIYIKSEIKNKYVSQNLKKIVQSFFYKKTESIKLSEEQRLEIKEAFKDSNESLSLKFNLNLKKYKYYV